MGFVRGASAASGDERHSNRIPTNPRLWKLIILQAKMKFKTYPNPAASHWVHEEYVKHGGQFAEHNARTRELERRRKRHEKDRRSHALKSERTKKMEKGGKKNEDTKD